MRDVMKVDPEYGGIFIEEIEINLDSRHELPKILLGLQTLYCNEPLRQRLHQLLQDEVLPGVDLNNGRPAMGLWQALVLAIVKQGAGMDFDQLQDTANCHEKLRQMLGHSKWLDSQYTMQQLVNNVALFSVEFLGKVSALVVEAGHELEGQGPGEMLHGRCDSFVVETDVHFPTDVSLLFDAVRRVLQLMHKACKRHSVCGWRQHKHLQKKLKRLYNRIRKSRQWQARPAAVHEYLSCCAKLAQRAGHTLGELREVGVEGKLYEDIAEFKGYADKLADQVERRVLHGEVIPQSEKMFSVFEPHTRWIAKGKAGRPVELGVPLCIMEDQHRFILHHEVMWKGEDVDYAVPMVKATQQRYAGLHQCSFDRGFHSPDNRQQLDELLEVNVLPAKGKLSKVAKRRELEGPFKAARQQHPAVESKINDLEHRGLDRVRTHGAKGFERTVALSVLACNVHRYGQLVLERLRQKERHRLKLAA